MHEPVRERELAVRAAVASDAPSLRPLLAELGYPTPPGAVTARLARVAGFGPAVALVATTGSEVVGLVTVHAFPTIHADPPAAWLTALVVSPAARRRGVGALLVRAAERWAAAQGAVRISLSSGGHRADAHRFYEALGYETTGRRFTRALP